MLKAPMEICAVGFHGYVEVMSNKEKYFYNMTNPYRCNTKKNGEMENHWYSRFIILWKLMEKLTVILEDKQFQKRKRIDGCISKNSIF